MAYVQDAARLIIIVQIKSLALNVMEYSRAKYRTKRDKRSRLKFCLSCGKNKPFKSYKRCLNCKSRMDSRQKAWRIELKDLAFKAYGGYKCSWPKCTETRTPCLEIDHINNDGATHRKSVRGGNSLYIWLHKNNYPSGFQILCKNCNYFKYVSTLPITSIYHMSTLNVTH